MRPETLSEARAVRAEIARQVQAALTAGQLWHNGYLWCRNSKLARARRHALRCRAQAVVLFDRNLENPHGTTHSDRRIDRCLLDR